MAERTVTHFRWHDMAIEEVSGGLSRRLVTGDRMMLAHVYIKKGCIVPRHSHENEQITYILEGGLRFWIGADESQTLDVDIFSPPRQDGLDKTDDYLRR